MEGRFEDEGEMVFVSGLIQEGVLGVGRSGVGAYRPDPKATAVPQVVPKQSRHGVLQSPTRRCVGPNEH